MRIWGVAALAALMLGGCAPKMGREILIEPASGIRMENSGREVMVGVMWLLGAPVDKEAIRLGGDVRVSNRWHSDIRIASLVYTLTDEGEVIAQGEAKKSANGVWMLSAGSEKTIPLSLRVDMEKLTPSRIDGVIRSKRKLMLRGDAVIDVWGWERHYTFEKEATKEIAKALKKI